MLRHILFLEKQGKNILYPSWMLVGHTGKVASFVIRNNISTKVNEWI